MSRYRIYRLKDAPRENFRWAPHIGGLALVKPKDYEVAGEAEAPGPYAAWKNLAVEGRPLHAGDLIETITAGGSPGDLVIAKYIGFEPAKWQVPEIKSESGFAPAESAFLAGAGQASQLS
jgi:hypothetical protein